MGLLCLWRIGSHLYLVRQRIFVQKCFPASLTTLRFILVFYAPKTTFAAGPSARSEFTIGAGFVVFMTMLYPIAWACSEGGNVISPVREMVWYGILDLITGPLLLFNYVFGLRDIEFNSFGVHSGKFSDGPEYAQGMTNQPAQNMATRNRAPTTGAGAGTAPGGGTAGTPSGPAIGMPIATPAPA